MGKAVSVNNQRLLMVEPMFCKNDVQTIWIIRLVKKNDCAKFEISIDELLVQACI